MPCENQVRMRRNMVYSTGDRAPLRTGEPLNVRYKKLPLSDKQDGFADAQFESPPPRVPWRAIVLASILFCFGSAFILLGAMLLSGYIDAKYSDRTWPLLILGTLMFVPGAYHVRIAIYAYRGRAGFSFDDIPDFD